MGKELVLLISLVLCGLAVGGTVRRDPASGKWIEVSDDAASSMRDSRVDGSDGGFFGGLDFIDSRPSSTRTLSSAPTQTLSVVTSDRPSRTRKYTAVVPKVSEFSLPVITHIQTQTRSLVSQDDTEVDDTPTQPPTIEGGENGDGQEEEEIQEFKPPTSVEKMVHEFEPVVDIQVSQYLPARSIGSVCRYQGMRPLTNCPAEAANGCVDILTCDRSCEDGGYFNWRCVGFVDIAPEDMVAPLEVVEEETPVRTDEQVVAELAMKMETAFENQDFNSLAYAILNARNGDGGASAHHLASSFAALVQNNKPHLRG